jgi:hypothetical protein
MNQFINDYLERLRRISSDEDVIKLYYWFWDNQDKVKRTAEEMNQNLGLYEDYALKPDLPCLSVGSRNGLVYLFVNPGWRKDLSAREDAYCRRSKDDYVDVMFNFFVKHPNVVGERITFGAQMISFVGLLRNGLERFGPAKTATAKWQQAHSSHLIGHWELFPFHSSSDGLTRYVNQYPWLSLCMRESIAAIIRLQPELLIVMSKFGWNMLRNDVLVDHRWKETALGRPSTRLSYCVITGETRKTEIVAIPRQVFSSHRICTNQEFFSAVNALRLNYSNDPSEQRTVPSHSSQTEFTGLVRKRKVIRILPEKAADKIAAPPRLLNHKTVGLLFKARTGTARYLITFTRTKNGQSETVQMAWREHSPELAAEKTFGHWEKRGYRCEGPQSVSLIEGSVAQR